MWVFSIRVPVLRCFGSVMVAWRAAAGGVQQRRGGVAGGVGGRLHLSAALVGSVDVEVKTWTTTAADAVPLWRRLVSEPHHFAVLRILRVKI